jgi:O6-methylguanine-DNA--protein-cysteine methyltransferase
MSPSAKNVSLVTITENDPVAYACGANARGVAIPCHCVVRHRAHA